MIVENKRNYDVDLLRIVSMFMIVMLHVLGPVGFCRTRPLECRTILLLGVLKI